jgi:P27 family predicted phage terminase small subunit
MPRGRKPTPTTLKILRGTNRGRPNAEPRLPAAIPDCPEHLDEIAKAEWDSIAPQLLALGLVAKIDKAGLAAYCQSWSRWIQAEELIRESGQLLVSSKSGQFYSNPAVAVADKMLNQLRAFLIEFGLTPSSRSRLHVQGADPMSKDKKERFFRAS